MKKIFSTIVMAFAALTASAYDLTVGTSENGSISFKVEGEAATAADAGKTVTVVIAPNDGYVTTAVTARAYTGWGSARALGLNPGLVDEITLTGSDNEWTFTMPEANVEVSADYIIHIPTPAGETGETIADDKELKNVAAIMEVAEGQTPVTDPESGITTVPVVMTGVDIPVQADASAASPKGITVEVQAATQVGKTVFVLTGIAAGAFKSKEPTAVVTRVILPETDAALPVEEGAMKPDGEPISIYTPLALLDDYALMASLKDNFEASLVNAVAEAPNRFWTISSGVDIVLPAGLTAYTVYIDGGAIRYAEIPEADLALAGGRRGIKANNGVLLSGEKGTFYILEASPGNQQSGSVPATTDAKSFAGNQLEPVIESTNYEAGQYYVLKDNEFHSIKANASKVKACKAVLRIQ